MWYVYKIESITRVCDSERASVTYLRAGGIDAGLVMITKCGECMSIDDIYRAISNRELCIYDDTTCMSTESLASIYS